MLLDKLFKDAPNIRIDNLMIDSRVHQKRSIYFCIKGIMNDGHAFVEQAISNGAIAIVYSDEVKNPADNIIYIKVTDVRTVLRKVLVEFYHNPSAKLSMIGVTGTNGKTSVTNIITDILGKEESVGYIGTLGIQYDDIKIEPLLTTPNIVDLFQTLDDMVKSNIKVCAMEVSSIGLQQGRVDNIEFDYAIFTNLSHDHLDYHGTVEAYFGAKKMMFDDLDADAVAIVNIDDDHCIDIINDTNASVITYGINNAADYMAKDIELYKNKTILTLCFDNSDYRVETNLVALFNVYNLLAAVATLVSYGVEIENIIEKLNNIHQIEGRMETINTGQNYNVIVDFAHTPDGIEKVMKYAKSITPKQSRIIAVFGSAGKRDTRKRVVFGELADKYCDMIILTEDDPRDESIVDIANEIAQGIIKTNYIIIESRYDAIRQAVELVNENDTILILGKGDEQFMYREYGTEAYMGDDNVAREVIEKYGAYEEEYEYEL